MKLCFPCLLQGGCHTFAPGVNHGWAKSHLGNNSPTKHHKNSTHGAGKNVLFSGYSEEDLNKNITAEITLYHKLLSSDYVPQIRPARDPSHTIVVQFHAEILSLDGIVSVSLLWMIFNGLLCFVHNSEICRCWREVRSSRFIFLVSFCAQDHGSQILHAHLWLFQVVWVFISSFTKCILFSIFVSWRSLQFLNFQTWYDPLLTWDPSENDDIKTINLPVDRIWKPDITLWNK